jgi:hypothetical protein
MTKIQICSALGLTHDDVASVLTRLRRDSIKFGKRIYICEWQREAIGKKYHLRPVFTAGKRADKIKPPAFTLAQRAAKSHKKRMAIKQMAKYQLSPTL